MIVEIIEFVFPAFMSFQKPCPKQTTLLLFGALLSSPQLEQAKGAASFEQSGQLVELIVQKNLILPLARRSATRSHRFATTSPRSFIVAVCFSHVGT
jgi:hypothetical protein